MVFTEFRFIPFFLIVFFVSWLIKKNDSRKIWLTLCSYCFYGIWDWRFLSLIVGSTVIDYTVGLMLSKSLSNRSRKAWLSVSLVANLGILGFFKYYNFFADSAADFFNFLGIPFSSTTLNIVLPVGISFYTFQTMSYSIDVYFKKLEARQKFLDLAFFVAFFPQLVAGPIVRAAEFLPQLDSPRYFQLVKFRSCLVLLIIGFFKKACISDNLAPIIDQYFSMPENYTVLSSWIGVLSYAVQIYCDFSGYSDMAIACAGLLGYKLCLNFDFPYFASSITDFWRRWHISLSSWLKDYLYIPLGGNRGTKLFTYRNLMLTMLLGGLWHGAAWNFVIWGGLHGIALIVHREWSQYFCSHNLLFRRAMTFFNPILTFYWVCIAWIFFRAADLSTSITIFKSFVFFQTSGLQELNSNLLWLLVALVIAHWLFYQNVVTNWWHRISSEMFATIYGFSVAAILTLVPTGYTPFIYFQF